MLKTAGGIAASLGLATVAVLLAPAAVTGIPSAILLGGTGILGGIAGSVADDVRKRFGERASAYAERMWGPDKNDHFARGIRKAQVEATGKLLRAWQSGIATQSDQEGRALVSLLADWCTREGTDDAIEAWSQRLDGSEAQPLRTAFETAFGQQVEGRALMEERAHQARVLAVSVALEDAVAGALAKAEDSWAETIRKSAAFVSFNQAFSREGADGWFDQYLHAIGREFTNNPRFKDIWIATQTSALSAMVSDIRVDATQIKDLIAAQTESLSNVGTVIAEIRGAQIEAEDAAQRRQIEAENAAQRRHDEQMAANTALRVEVAREKGIDPALLQPLFENLGQTGLTLDEMRTRAGEVIKETIDRGRQQVTPGNEGLDIDATIAAARKKLAALDVSAARSLLNEKIIEEEKSRRERLVPLLEEKAAVERLQYNYDSAKETLKQLLALDPDRFWTWIALGDAYVTTGPLAPALEAFSNAAEAARRTGDERNLLVAYTRTGDVLFEKENLDGALTAFRDALAIAERLATIDPTNVARPHDLLVSYSKVGQVLVRQGRLDEALKAFRRTLKIIELLGNDNRGDPDWQFELSGAYEQIGEVLFMQGKFHEALKAFRAGVDIRFGLVERAPGNARWQRHLSASYNNVGKVLVRQGFKIAALKSFRQSMAVMQDLSQRDPSNTRWQRDLSKSYELMGDVLAEQGKLDEALTPFFYDALAIAERLAKIDPWNASWQRDLLVSYNKIAQVLALQGNRDAALITCHKGLGIAESRAKLDPTSADAQFDLGFSYELLGQFSEAQDKQSACRYFQTALAAFKAAVNLSPDWADAKNMAQTAAQGAARCCG